MGLKQLLRSFLLKVQTSFTHFSVCVFVREIPMQTFYSLSKPNHVKNELKYMKYKCSLQRTEYVVCHINIWC